ncbi:hypothetical protein D3C87_1714500 [compost metagenome]
MALRSAERDCNHVAGHQTCDPDAQIETVSYDIDHFPLRNDVDMHVGIAAQEFECER